MKLVYATPTSFTNTFLSLSDCEIRTLWCFLWEGMQLLKVSMKWSRKWESDRKFKLLSHLAWLSVKKVSASTMAPAS